MNAKKIHHLMSIKQHLKHLCRNSTKSFCVEMETLRHIIKNPLDQLWAAPLSCVTSMTLLFSLCVILMSHDLKHSTGLRQRYQSLRQEQRIPGAFTSEINERERPAPCDHISSLNHCNNHLHLWPSPTFLRAKLCVSVSLGAKRRTRGSYQAQRQT